MSHNLNTTRFRNAKVFYRVFPMVKMQWEYVKILEDKKTIYMRYLQDFGVGKEDSVPSYWRFETDGVFYNNTQEEIYNVVMSGVLEKVAEGCNAVILTYGQTGSGKSLTASGIRNAFKDRGIAPRIISDLFEKKKSLKNRQKICIQMSYIETNKMYLTDLLNPSEDMLDAQALKHIKVIKLKDEYDAMKILFKAEGRRKFTKDFLRSHVCNGVLTLHVYSRPVNQTDPVTKVSKIHIVDLAGTDTYGNATCFNKNVFDVANANLAKSQLEQFVLILCENVHEHILVKQRLNILIQYLSDSLNAHSLLRCVGHIRTDKENLLLTISMLRFGQVIRRLKPRRLYPNVTEDKEAKIKQLEEEVQQIKQENHLEVMLKNGDLSTNITQERIKHMQNVAEEYLQDKTDELVLLNVTDVTTVVKVFKNLYNKLEAEKIECTRAAYERAYEDAMVNMKRQPSKQNSVTSKGSRRGSYKSKNKASITSDGGSQPKINKKSSRLSESASKQSSLTKLSESRKSAQSVRQKSQDRSPSPLKQAKPSSISLSKKSVGGKRKSGSTSGVLGGTDVILEEMPLPSGLPCQSEVWNLFVNDDNYGYRNLVDSINASEENANSIRREYMEEVNTLHKCQELVDLRKYELQKAQMLRLMKKEEHDEEGNVVISDTEKRCTENFNKAQEELLQQQETVLKTQAEFGIALEIYQNAKNTLNEKYEEFCQATIHTSLPIFPSAEQVLTQESQKIDITEEQPRKSVSNKQECANIERYENLKSVMDSEMQKTINERKKTAKWVQSCKT